MRKSFSLRGSLLAAIALTAFCVPSWAQGNIRTVLFVKVKLGQEESWKAAVKDYAATVKKQAQTRASPSGSLRVDRRNTRLSGIRRSGRRSTRRTRS